MSYRKTTQALLPSTHAPAAPGQYDIYPGFPIGPGKIALGFAALAERLVGHQLVTLDGYAGVLWDDLRARLDAALGAIGWRAAWLDARQALRTSAEVERLVAPFLGGDDPLFGTRFTGALADFFDLDALAALRPDEAADLSIVYGPGAALAGWDGLLVYVDLPKNELQFRARAGVPTNLTLDAALPAKAAYKRSYFVDWPALNAHKAALLGRVDLLVDGQRADEPAHIAGGDLRAALDAMSRSAFRVRPWFEPGPWGGQWIKDRIPALPQDVPNYAWSFELIFPENGLLLESDGRLLEVSFDALMFQHSAEVLGAAAERFGHEFPIRFDFLDTVRGGNLSVQCHPRLGYIRQHFGERLTQDETYYILDAEPGASVYLGFQDDIAPEEFRAALEHSYATAAPVEIERFVQRHPAARHDLFLIPNGTVHCSGVGSLVLEISATPYIFTFKMYDWLRLDLDGAPRPLNIERAFANLRFERRGARVAAELIAHPALAAEGPGWRLIDLPTHPDHFYTVRRYEFERSVEIETGGDCHVMSLVDGQAVLLEPADGSPQRFSYAETFVVPAAAGRYRLTNLGGGVAKVVQAFVKRDWLADQEAW
jgi:mannose-6-phosphate isomerase class I